MTIRAYYLKTSLVDGTEVVDGIDIIHDAVMEDTSELGIRLVIMDADASEDSELSKLSIIVREPTKKEVEFFNSLPPASEGRNVIAELDDLKSRVDALEKAKREAKYGPLDE